jgi:putative phosphoesterase
VRVAALYDVHGNLPALEAVLEEVEREPIDTIVIGGDFAAGPFPAQTVERLRALGSRAHFICGNADRELVRPSPPREGGPPPELVEWTRSQLSAEQLEFLTGLPEQEIVEIDELGRVLFCHATPRSDEELVTIATPKERLREIFAGVVAAVVVCGHTHMQFDQTIGETRVVNAGSVGMPYEDEAGAYWALLGPDVRLRRTVYDFAAARAAIASSGWPSEWPEATRQEATDFFESLARG